MLVLATSLEKGKKLVGAVIREVNGIELKFYSGRLMASWCAESAGMISSCEA
jgi:hypothetical protein